ncbi:MAG TPA: leucyl/phenylalanyl-tRNA--protein transferase [Anaeromyxobacteraceae bacterium]|nr:leucyl/phenylalanyl-tRNA--protein transferase [Anaeromyxobacteraceae bacterium]
MAIHRLHRTSSFPDPETAEPDGLLAVGGDLSPGRLVAAYERGIFPWYSEGSPILWWSPDPRMVLLPSEFHVPRSLARTMRSRRYDVRSDTAFPSVIRRCAEKERPGQDGTWIVPEVVEAYEALYRLGLAHSVEAWEGAELAGGLYGVSLGGTFFGESMFADRPDASKVAFAALVGWLGRRGFDLVDCQVETEHLSRFGARSVPRREFRTRLAASLEKATLRGAWDVGDGRGG